ncbi:Tryptophanyl-tRNA synthetase [Metarhizium album ARSEF 1941]|uniref:tryptophan--tRNA ligase n=1 Tax=Metarhizium album (strain ARSEF 1941) TaxID=1081103 RepID=A0A0B2X606_METAS|nr:Tryptophanyl-tRNA synthetase [Metarhizium album ARSEF 1941]KHO00890.1 Tryptophanyl-tRNA synthetase [Metarhizium album ARSEF 1941]
MQRLSSKSTATLPRVVFSGIQPTGIPHLGNYVGALRQWVQLQHYEPKDTKLIYSIVDLHAITTPQPPEKLKRWKRESLAALLAVGIDPERSIVFHQSSVSSQTTPIPRRACSLRAHVDPSLYGVCWISLSDDSMEGANAAPIDRRKGRFFSALAEPGQQKLNLAPTSHVAERPAESRLKLGLFSYPVLQAADILVHRATHVPVGHDQQQHLEFALYPKTITFYPAPVHRVMSLSDPTSKMSKSHEMARSRILITDTPDEIRLKISSALTDSVQGISYDYALRPGISNLLTIFSMFDAEKRSPEQLAQAYRDIHPRVFKDMVSDAIILGLQSIRTRYTELIDGDTRYLDYVAAEGARKALHSAEETMSMVRTAIGL